MKKTQTSLAAPAQTFRQGASHAANSVQRQSLACIVKVSAVAVLALTSSVWAQEIAVPASDSVKPAITLSAKKAAKAPVKDIFAGDNWHAVAPSWPGVLSFDDKTKRVSLKPMGANPFEANYSYSLNTEKQAKKTSNISGRMTFSDDVGRTSEMTFTLLDKKELTLVFTNGQRQEIYRRMSAAEVREYEQKIKDMLSGKVPLPRK